MSTQYINPCAYSTPHTVEAKSYVALESAEVNFPEVVFTMNDPDGPPAVLNVTTTAPPTDPMTCW